MAENGCHLDPQTRAGADPKALEGSGCGLSQSQSEVLERCLHALTHAKNDSHVLAALLLVNNCLSSSSTSVIDRHWFYPGGGQWLIYVTSHTLFNIKSP